MKSVKEIMTKDPACCEPNTPLTECAKMMCEHDCGEIPVVSGSTEKKLVGVITDRDIVCRAVVKGSDIRSAKVGDFMTKDCATVKENSSIDECINVLKQRQIRRVPVVDEQGKCCGIVSQADLARKERPERTADFVRRVSEPVHV